MMGRDRCDLDNSGMETLRGISNIVGLGFASHAAFGARQTKPARHDFVDFVNAGAYKRVDND